MGLIGSLFKIGTKARITSDSQGNLASSLIGKKCTIVGRVRSQDMDGERAYAAVPDGRKNPKTFWASELKKESKRK